MFNLFKKKKSRSETLANNRIKGKMGERQTEIYRSLIGQKLTKKRTGHDYEAEVRFKLPGVKYKKKYIETKATKSAPLRPLQKKMKRNKPKNYEVDRWNF